MMVLTRSIFSCFFALLVVASTVPAVHSSVQVEQQYDVSVDSAEANSMSMSYHEHQRRKLTWDFFGFLMMSRLMVTQSLFVSDGCCTHPIRCHAHYLLLQWSAVNAVVFIFRTTTFVMSALALVTI
jgi:hypothetical protein